MRQGEYQRISAEEQDASQDNEPYESIGGSRFTNKFKFNKVAKITLATSFILVLCILSLFFSYDSHHSPALSLDEYRRGLYAAHVSPISWLPAGKHGQYIVKTPSGYNLSSWESTNESYTVAPLKISSAEGEVFEVQDVKLNRQQSHALLVTSKRKNWRHSSFAKYWILEISSQTLTSLNKKSSVSIATWSPDGLSVSYVLDHDIYHYQLSDGTTSRVTNDGGESMFNGIPDWVYEEEVFSGDSALWWSPDSQHIAFLKTNDSLVPKFPIPYFMKPDHDKNDESVAYPELVELKYPKPGYPNPVVSIWIYDVRKNTTKSIDIPTSLNEPIIFDALWVGTHLVTKIMNRESDFLEVWVYNSQDQTIQRSRSYSSRESGGSWFEITHNTIAVGSEGYVDIIDNDGYNHLAYFSPATSSSPKYLTSGPWEVQDRAIAVNEETRHVFFHGSKRSSMEFSLYAISLDKPEEEPQLVAFEGEGVYSADFSGDCSFATVTYTSPTAPLIQKVVKLSKPASNDELITAKEWRIEENSKLRQLLASRGLLRDNNVVYGSVEVSPGVEVNYREIRPTNFRKSHKHPLLFFNYGGPGSQQIFKFLSIDFQRIVAETHNAVVVTVDPRGTGNKGRAFRATVRDHLGDWEAHDVISVAKQWNAKSYIDSRTTAIWGWSYGGFLTLKTLEKDTDLAFKYGIAVAPVTDWSLYDSIYTERYMHKPVNNEQGYNTSRIADIDVLAKHERFLIMHGTGDDNVHFQNTLQLLDKLDLAGIENYDVHVFPDSDHSINFHNANAVVYDKIDQWLRIQQTKS